MKRYCRFWISGAFIAVVAGCGGERVQEQQPEPGATSTPIAVKYASGFKISRLGNAKVVEVTYPFQGASNGYTYLLVPKGQAPPEYPGARIIYTPIETIVCTSTSHVPLLDYIGETEKLVGFPTTRYISSEKMRERIADGHVTELGIDKGLNLERLAVLQPELVMGYTLSGDYGQFRKVEALGIPVVINGEYLEQHPLGRAEWIKFMALFFHKEQEADSVFSAIEESYLEAKASVENVPIKPTVLSGIVYGDAWFLPGGQNYAARLFKDAGCRYFWEENESHGFLELSFESVYETAQAADLWIGTGSYKSLSELGAADARYTLFHAYQKRQVFNYDARISAGGGNEFLELGYLRPDLILKDLIAIAHPGRMQDHSLFFHRRLPEH